mmetsp:Transcript_45379/g.108485  ORF Transcript_45379/g.108485 Transcript_45379/m.108485 type:complete len:565 (+) Transcript_45379:7625-9319(+)
MRIDNIHHEVVQILLFVVKRNKRLNRGDYINNVAAVHDVLLRDNKDLVVRGAHSEHVRLVPDINVGEAKVTDSRAGGLVLRNHQRRCRVAQLRLVVRVGDGDRKRGRSLQSRRRITAHRIRRIVVGTAERRVLHVYSHRKRVALIAISGDDIPVLRVRDGVHDTVSSNAEHTRVGLRIERVHKAGAVRRVDVRRGDRADREREQLVRARSHAHRHVAQHRALVDIQELAPNVARRGQTTGVRHGNDDAQARVSLEVEDGSAGGADSDLARGSIDDKCVAAHLLVRSGDAVCPGVAHIVIITRYRQTHKSTVHGVLEDGDRVLQHTRRLVHVLHRNDDISLVSQLPFSAISHANADVVSRACLEVQRSRRRHDELSLTLGAVTDSVDAELAFVVTGNNGVQQTLTGVHIRTSDQRTEARACLQVLIHLDRGRRGSQRRSLVDVDEVHSQRRRSCLLRRARVRGGDLNRVLVLRLEVQGSCCLGGHCASLLVNDEERRAIAASDAECHTVVGIRIRGSDGGADARARWRVLRHFAVAIEHHRRGLVDILDCDDDRSSRSQRRVEVV